MDIMARYVQFPMQLFFGTTFQTTQAKDIYFSGKRYPANVLAKNMLISNMS